MVLILDGNSEKDVHVKSNLCYLNCLRHWLRWRAVTNQIFFSDKPIFLYASETCSELLSNVDTKRQTEISFQAVHVFHKDLNFSYTATIFAGMTPCKSHVARKICLHKTVYILI